MKKTIIIAAIMLLVAGTVSLDASTKKKATTKKAASTSQVIYTGDIASKVLGYNGTTPLNITVKNGIIESIEVLPNQESPAYLKRAKEKVLPQYVGKSVADAKKLKPDIATGATYTSEALIKNIQKGLEQVKSTATSKKKATSAKKTTKKRR